MAKKILAVYDSDLDYVNRFVSYLKDKRNLPFKAIGFSKKDALENFLVRNSIDILLISENCLERKEDQKESFFDSRQISETIFLGDPLALENEEHKINKYQSMENIILELVKECRIEDVTNLETQSLSGVDVFLVYSPASDFRKQGFSLSLADALSQDKSVLYINLERFSGLKKAFKEPSKTISDVIYFYKTSINQFGQELRNSVIKKRNFEILLGPDDMEDIDLIADEELSRFLALLSKTGGYDVIVIDMDEAFKKITDVFEISKAIFVPVSKGAISEFKIEEFKEHLELREKEDIKEKMVITDLGAASEKELSEMGNYPDSCFFGKLKRKAEEALKSSKIVESY